ncbi:RHS repeat domain-containing protein, partial [Neisseria canis]
LLWYGEYTAWGRLKTDERVYQHVHQPFRLQNQYCDEETGLHYNLMRYYEPDCGRFVNQDPIGLWGGDNFYLFAPNTQNWIDSFGLARKKKTSRRTLVKNWSNYVGSRPIHDEVHHGFPEEFADRFKKIADIDINDPKYYYDLTVARHRHLPRGVHTNGSRLGKNWNKVWAGILDRVEKMNLSKNEAKIFLEKRLRELARKERISKYNAQAVRGARVSMFSRITNIIQKFFKAKC